MKVVIQRVKSASVSVDNKVLGQIDQGLCLLVGFTDYDNQQTIKYIARKIVNMRIFQDQDNKMNNSLINENGKILSISQFTLLADTRHGNRPSFTEAGDFENSKELYNRFNEELRKYDIKVEEGEFGANMQVSILNDGPVTIILEK
ncbi:D-aminoacyl-tRNA deacylase [Companilactobacillus metriopterae]|uniref:D-aminoacyl-tRNA deacylase n=1 Tax=Companilactobacillus metriopterae TaxID=1909267 RepID=UPI00100A9C42|nr:D-aminoacyl-tRNA deacylase [Companilactobacillus metriopterae]